MSQQKVDRYKQEKAASQRTSGEGKETKKAPSHLQLFRTCSNRTCDCFCQFTATILPRQRRRQKQKPLSKA